VNFADAFPIAQVVTILSGHLDRDSALAAVDDLRDHAETAERAGENSGARFYSSVADGLAEYIERREAE
jgi:hypothetical protein